MTKKGYRKTHCKRGHERIPENLNNQGGCKLCIIPMAKERYQDKKGTPEYKAREKKRRSTDKFKENRKLLLAKPEMQTYLIEYRKKPENKARKNEARRKAEKMKVDNLDDSYVADLLGSTAKLIPKPILELKRLQITLLREIKKCKESRPLMTSV